MAVQIVSFHCVLKNSLGQVIGKTFNQDVIVSQSPSQKNLIGLVEGLKDLQVGEKRKVRLRAEQAYGFYDPDLVTHYPIDQLDMFESLKVGDQLPLSIKGDKRRYRVIEIIDGIVTLDGNHPLAGQDLVFEIEATQARDATPEDFEQMAVPNNSQTYH